jgi:hypothetical protein
MLSGRMSSDASALTIPMIRARHMQTLVSDVDRLPAEDRRAIRRAIAPQTLERIAAGTLLEWVPFSVDVECSRAIAEHLGPERADQFFRRQILDSVETNLLAGFVQGALRFAGAEPGLYLPFLGKGYSLLFRGCGRLTARQEPPNAMIAELRGLPAEAMTDGHWIGSVRSSLGALGELIGLQSRVVVTHTDAAQGHVVFHVTW